jgi:hypothetical protein
MEQSRVTVVTRSSIKNEHEVKSLVQFISTSSKKMELLTQNTQKIVMVYSNLLHNAVIVYF